jgi:NADPH-dependent ferric siderophore reductase
VIHGPDTVVHVTRKRLIDAAMVAGTVVAVADATPRMRWITLGGPAVARLSWIPGQHVRVQVGVGSGVLDRLFGALRTYSVWDRVDDGLRLCVLDHGDGPGSLWGRDAQVGDRVVLMRPEGNLVLRPGPYHLFVGEETASVAFGPMMRALPDPDTVRAVIEVDDESDRLPLPDGVAWTFRRGTSAASSESLVKAVRALDLPTEPGVAYVAGEARTIQSVRAHLVQDRGWPRRSVVTKPFWTPGRTGLD